MAGMGRQKFKLVATTAAVRHNRHCGLENEIENAIHREVGQSDQALSNALKRQSVNDRSKILAIPASDRCILKGQTMAKGKNSKKEIKKPKKEKPKVSATAGSQNGKPAISMTGKK